MSTDLGVQQAGGATGVPADGAMDRGAMEPLGRPGLHRSRQAAITKPGLDDRGSVFFAAVEMTRMPMITADPRQDYCPIAFANNAFLDLTGYEEEVSAAIAVSYGVRPPIPSPSACCERRSENARRSRRKS